MSLETVAFLHTLMADLNTVLAAFAAFLLVLTLQAKLASRKGRTVDIRSIWNQRVRRFSPPLRCGWRELR